MKKNYVGLCNGTATPGPTAPPPVAPPGTTCGSGQVAKFTRIDGIELEGNDDATIPNVSDQDCVKLCANNQVLTRIFKRENSKRFGSGLCQILCKQSSINKNF